MDKTLINGKEYIQLDRVKELMEPLLNELGLIEVNMEVSQPEPEPKKKGFFRRK